jgi:uncharacterized protein (TIRG00374 family)
MRRAAAVATVVGVGLAVGSPFVLGGSAALASLHDVAPQMILILAGLATVSGIAKAGKLHVLLVSLGQRPVFPRTLAISLATDFASLSSPAGAAGYVVNIALLRTAGTSWVVATGVVGAEQALDLVFFAVAVPVAAFSALGSLAQVVPKVSGSVCVALPTVALLATCGLWYSRHRMVEALHTFVCAVPWLQVKQERFGEFLSELRAQMGTLVHGDANRNLALLLLTTLQWLTRYGVLWVVLLELGYELPFGFVLVLQAGVLHLAQWTGIPAGGGSADIALAAALATWVSSSTMAAVLILWRFATLYFPLLVGALALAALTGGWRMKK